jgi:hypothetical protein
MREQLIPNTYFEHSRGAESIAKTTDNNKDQDQYFAAVEATSLPICLLRLSSSDLLKNR